MPATEFAKQSLSARSGAALTTLNIPLYTGEESICISKVAISIPARAQSLSQVAKSSWYVLDACFIRFLLIRSDLHAVLITILPSQTPSALCDLCSSQNVPLSLISDLSVLFKMSSCVFGSSASFPTSLHLFAVVTACSSCCVASLSQSSRSFKSGRTAQSCSLPAHLELPLVLARYFDIPGAESAIATLNTQ
jgi:hypothetical protein